MTNSRNESLKAALEERYINVTFVKDIDQNRKLFTIGENSEELIIYKAWVPETLLTTLDLKALEKELKVYGNALIKFNKFKELALQGKTEITASAFKKLTIKKIEALLEE